MFIRDEKEEEIVTKRKLFDKTIDCKASRLLCAHSDVLISLEVKFQKSRSSLIDIAVGDIETPVSTFTVKRFSSSSRFFRNLFSFLPQVGKQNFHNNRAIPMWIRYKFPMLLQFQQQFAFSKMKFLVVFLVINILGQYSVLSQFRVPGFNVQIPTPAPITVPTVPAFDSQDFQVPSSAAIHVPTIPAQNLPSFDQLSGGLQQNNPLRSFEQIFNPLSNILPNNPINALIQEFANMFNVSSLMTLPLSGSRQFNSNAGYDSVPEPIRHSLENALALFDKVVNSSIVKGHKRIQNSFEHLNKTANSAIELAENLVTTGLQDINSTISKYNETVQNCVYDKSSHFEAIIPDAGDEVRDCVHEKISEVKNIIANGDSNIVEVIDGAKNMTAIIQQCSSEEAQENYHFGVIGCYISALFNVHRDTILLPVQIARRFGEMDISIASARGDVFACTSRVSEAIAAQSMNVTETIADCLIKR